MIRSESDPETRPAMRLLGVFAHPDDETFCIGGTFAKYIAAGAEAMVVSFTRGEAGQIRDAQAATRRTLGQTREKEFYAACAALGVQHSHCFDYGDGRLAEVPAELLVKHICQLIRDFKPDIVFTFDDSGAYGHPDHIAVSRATTRACFLAGAATSFPEQLNDGRSAHNPTRLYHASFPRSGRLLLKLLVNWLENLDEKFRGSPEFIHGLMLFADESTMLGYASDHIKIEWYPSDFYIIEQGEPATNLYLVLSGAVGVIKEDDDGKLISLGIYGPGTFMGETGLAYGQPRNAHVVAAKDTTCLVFSPGEPTKFAGRGEAANFATVDTLTGSQQESITTCIDVSDFVEQKMTALAQHRTQYPISADMFPHDILVTLLGDEYFKHVLPPVQVENSLLPDERQHYQFSASDQNE